MSEENIIPYAVELIRLGNDDVLEAIKLLSRLSEQGVEIEAEIALHVALRCFEAEPPSKPKRPVGRPPLTFEQRIDRILDGKAASEGASMKRERSDRDRERCMQEYRQWMKGLPANK